MKSMQAREFREALNTITEPIEVYARSEKKGTWYPNGWDTPQTGLDKLAAEVDEQRGGTVATDAVREAPWKEVEEAHAEIARLKRELASRPAVSSQPMAITDAVGTRFVNPARPMNDAEARAWVKSLPAQDRAFFASRLGIKIKSGSGDSSDD